MPSLKRRKSNQMNCKNRLPTRTLKVFFFQILKIFFLVDALKLGVRDLSKSGGKYRDQAEKFKKAFEEKSTELEAKVEENTKLCLENQDLAVKLGIQNLQKLC